MAAEQSHNKQTAPPSSKGVVIKLKPRHVVGILILLALAVLFWPRRVPPPPASHQPQAYLQPADQAPDDALPINTTPHPAAQNLTLWPVEAVTLDNQNNRNNDMLRAGALDGQTYYSLLRFDLNAVPSGATVTHAALDLTGLHIEHLQPNGAWQLYLLDEIIPAETRLSHTYLQQTDAGMQVGGLVSTNLAEDYTNTFTLGPEQIAALQPHLAGGTVNFWLVGPSGPKDNLFGWAGNNAPGKDHQPRLQLRIIPPAEPEMAVALSPEAQAVSNQTGRLAAPVSTPPPHTGPLTLITSTPTPENIITLAAEAVVATEVAQRIGTYTPIPPNWVTPIVIHPTLQPANTATALYEEAAATAAAYVFGTPTPLPANVWTVTPTAPPTPIPPTRTPPPPVLVTATPTPANIVTVAALAIQATREAEAFGTHTPIPNHWKVPLVVTVPPPPEIGNSATASFRAAESTALAVLYGTPTPTPLHVWTATPAPLLVPVRGQVATPWSSPTPTATPRAFPAELIGKIGFLSNRSGGPQPNSRPQVYVINPDGTQLSILTDPVYYYAARARNSFSADQRFRVFVKEALRFDNATVPALYAYDYLYNAEWQLTHFGVGMAWDPVWSPTREQVVFIANESQDDEIWVIDGDGSGLNRLTETNEAYNAREIGKDTFVPEQNGHPSWSPDGNQIVFWSNRTGHKQIWVMNVDGSNLYSLSTTDHDDWNPIWFKYTDPARQP